MTDQQNVYQMITAVTARLAQEGVGKNQTNDFDKYKFRGIDDIYNALAPIISDVGLVILPEVTSRDTEIKQAKNGGALNFVTLNVKYHLVSSQDGSECLVTVPGEAMDRSDKATNKALSAAYKYMCFQVFCIPIDGTESETESPELGKNNSTGRKPESVGKTTSRETGEALDVHHQAVAAINLSCFNDDQHGFFEVWDEMTNDDKAIVWGLLHRDEKKTCKTWNDERKAAE